MRDFLSLISSSAQSLNLYKKLMDDMEEMIRKNIREAEEQLQEVWEREREGVGRERGGQGREREFDMKVKKKNRE